ncbi:Hypothetical protein ETEE_0971 [Edwardsiella anguillarum ET080813]|uniref:Uncharacterized protein n=1 Tax=Edwardsiella anguillarum ET080813 TaxID=667120 RepID=A0A076LH91_9GAMM|nr:Hypothetical protein ETEE_0971 [Edwardsiella anguillarum ET080813]
MSWSLYFAINALISDGRLITIIYMGDLNDLISHHLATVIVP